MAAEAPPRTLRDRIGGRWAVSWQGYLLLLPVSVVFVLTSVPVLQDADPPGFGVGVSIVSYTAAGVVLWLGSATVLRYRRARPVPVVLVAAVGALAWGVRSGVIAWAIDGAGMTSTTPVLDRLVFGSVLGAVAVPTTAWILGSLADFRARREEALERLVQEQVAVERQGAYVEAMRAGLVREVSAGLEGARRDIDEINLAGAGLPAEALEAMERVSREAVRRVSRETWQEGRAASTPSIADIVRVAATTRPFRAWSLLLLLPFWVVVLARVVPWGEAATVAAVTFVYVLAVIFLANRLVPSAPRPLLAYGVAIAALGAVGIVAGAVLWAFDDGREGMPELAVLATTATVLVVSLAGLARVFSEAERRGLRALDVSISAAEVRQGALDEQERRLRREIAIALHGTVGANLTAATMRLRRAMDNGDVDAATEALAESRRLLDVDLHALLLREHADVATALAELADQWFGLVDVTIEIDDAVVMSPTTAQAVIDIVTEGISNAVGHGGASAITVTVGQGERGVNVVIEDDGEPPVEGTPGLGSRMLDEHAPGRWRRESRGPRGSRLTLDVGHELMR